MSPALLLILAILVTLASMLAEHVANRRHRARLAALAAEWGMNFSPDDRFRLTPRVYRSFPVPGAAKIRIVDLIYGIDDDVYRYIFTAEYTAGVITGKRRVRRVGALHEPRDRGEDSPAVALKLAPGNLELIEQYRKLKPGGKSEAPSARMPSPNQIRMTN